MSKATKKPNPAKRDMTRENTIVSKRTKRAEKPSSQQCANASQQPSDVQRISSGIDNPKEEARRYDDKMGNNPMRWHFELCQLTGRIVHRIEKKSASKGEIESWIDRLNSISEKMQRWLHEREK